MTKLEDRLQDEVGADKQPKPGAGGPSPVQTELERELAAEEANTARDLRVLRAQEIIAQRRKNIAAITGQMESAAGGQQGQKQEQSLVEIVTSLLEKGLPVETVSRLADDMLRRSMGFPMMFGGTPGAPQQEGLTVAAITSLINLGKDMTPKTDPTIAEALKMITEELKSLRQQVNAPKPPATGHVMIRQKDGSWKAIPSADGQVEVVDLVQPNGKSVEEIHEENRHAEEQERIKTDREFKQSNAKTLENIAVSLGELGADFVESKTGQPAPRTTPAKTGPPTQPFKCEMCGAELRVPIGTKEFSCPKCHTVYGGVEKTPEKPPAPAPEPPDGE